MPTKPNTKIGEGAWTQFTNREKYECNCILSGSIYLFLSLPWGVFPSTVCLPLEMTPATIEMNFRHSPYSLMHCKLLIIFS